MAALEELRDFVFAELSDVDVFLRILKYGGSRQKVFRCFSVSTITNILKEFDL